jgi:hypothetical protein
MQEVGFSQKLWSSSSLEMLINTVGPGVQPDSKAGASQYCPAGVENG